VKQKQKKHILKQSEQALSGGITLVISVEFK
jgi:hypothetical protein